MEQSCQLLPIHGWRIMKGPLQITPRCAQETTSTFLSKGKYTGSESWLMSDRTVSFLIFRELGRPTVCRTRTQDSRVNLT